MSFFSYLLIRRWSEPTWSPTSMVVDSKLSRREALDTLTRLLHVRRPPWSRSVGLSQSMRLTISATVNQRFAFTPAAVTYPNTADDISAVLKVAQTYNYKATARGGGVRLTLANVIEAKLIFYFQSR